MKSTTNINEVIKELKEYQDMQDALKVEIEKLKGKITVILTTHYLEEAVALCDRIGIMAHGKFVAEGTSDELVALSGEKDFESAFVKLTNGGAL